MHLSVSVPGKVVLLGEYSVLKGGRALAMAVNRRATVTLTTNELKHCRIQSHDKRLKPADFQLSKACQLTWSDSVPDPVRLNYGVLDAVAGTLSERRIVKDLATLNFDIYLDSTEFFHHPKRVNNLSRGKLGLGSSAALVVALATALCAYGDCRERTWDDWIQDLITAHRQFQGNLGSGVDIATSINGGTILYRLMDSGAEWSKIRLPSALDHRFVWTGKSASTRGFLQKLGPWARAKPSEYKSIMDELGGHMERALISLETNDAAGLLEQAERFSNSLSKFSRLTDLDIYAHHHEIIMVAKTVGVLYKPCGAGGGDLGVALSDDPERLNEFANRVRQLNYTIVPLLEDIHGPIKNVHRS